MARGKLTSEELIRLYDRWAWTYNWTYKFWTLATESRAHRRLLELLQLDSGDRVLEVAVGSGTISRQLWKQFPGTCFWGIDLSWGMLRRCQSELRKSEGGQGARALCRADALSLPFPDAAFDVVLNCYLLDLLEEGDIVRAVREFGRVLRPGGRLVTASMGEPVGGWRELWNWAYRWNPRLVGGCRPVSAARYFLSTDWSMEHEETLSQMGFRSEMSVAFKLPFREDG